MAVTLHTKLINNFLNQRKEQVNVQITAEKVDNTKLAKSFIMSIEKKMDVNVFVASIEDLINNIEKEYPTAAITVIDENKSHQLYSSNEGFLGSKELVVKFKYK